MTLRATWADPPPRGAGEQEVARAGTLRRGGPGLV